MEKIRNDRIVELVEKIMKDSGDTMPENLAYELADCLADATLISPSNAQGNTMILQLGPHRFLPASCDIDDFNRVFEGETPEPHEFRDFEELIEKSDGIILNPGSFGFILNPAFSRLVFDRCGDAKAMTSQKGYDVKVRLDDFRPLTWRDLIIPAGITFKDLDNVMKILWNFSGYHLSRFTFKDSWDVITNEFEDIDFNPGERNSKNVIIDDYFENNKKIYWEYDYGDGWSFTIEVKKTVEYDKSYPLIKRFKGEYNPEDDIGGVGGMEMLMEDDSDKLTKFDQEDVQWDLEHFTDSVYDM